MISDCEGAQRWLRRNGTTSDTEAELLPGSLASPGSLDTLVVRVAMNSSLDRPALPTCARVAHARVTNVA